MKTVGAYEAKTHLPRLLEQAEAGEIITITKHGRAVAQLGPSRQMCADDVDKVIEEWDAYRRRKLTLGDDLTIRDLIEEGRRY